MDYLKEYYNIIDYRLINILNHNSKEYTELHHITPKGFFEPNTPDFIINRKENLVRLTGEEHYKVHYYLYKYYEKNDKSSKYYHSSFNSFKAMNMNTNNIRNINIDSMLYDKNKKELLNYYKVTGIEKVENLCRWIIENKRNPNKNSIDKNEKYYGCLLSNIKQSYKYKDLNNKINRARYFDEYKYIIKKYNLDDLFIIKSNKEIYIDKLKVLLDWIKINNKYPSKLDDNTLNTFYIKVRSDRKKNNWDPDFESLISKYNMVEYFKSTEERYIDKIDILCNFIDYNKRLPNLKNKKEKQLIIFFNNIKNSFNGGKCIKFKESYLNRFKLRGYDFLLIENLLNKDFTKILKENNKL